MNPSDNSDHPQLPTIKIHHPSSPHHPTSTATPTAGARRKIGVAVDLSEESAFAVHWSVQNYIRPGDAVILLHVSPTSVLFGADWGPLPHTPQTPETPQSQKQLEDDFDAFTASKAADLARPLKESGFPFKIHIVKDHDMRERLCLEVERLGLSAVIMGSRGFGAEKRGSDGRLGSVSDYCVHHCVCPVVVVRYPEDKDGGNGEPVVTVKEAEVEEEGGKDSIDGCESIWISWDKEKSSNLWWLMALG
ncbi:UspA - like 10 [Theobroma cacao]|nr:UspA - like 10 [Theobroma cacao]